MSTKNPTLVHFRHFSHFRHSFNYTVFPIHLFMQNKANFGNSKMNINACLSMFYVILSHWLRRKNKPNSNPIKPIQTQFKPNQTQFYVSLSRVYPREVQTWIYYRGRATTLTRNRGPIYLKGALKDKNNDVIIPRITMKNGL